MHFLTFSYCCNSFLAYFTCNHVIHFPLCLMPIFHRSMITPFYRREPGLRDDRVCCVTKPPLFHSSESSAPKDSPLSALCTKQVQPLWTTTVRRVPKE